MSFAAMILTIAWAAPVFAAGTPPPAAPDDGAPRLADILTWEEIPLPARSQQATIEVDAMGARIIVHLSPRGAATWREKASAICPRHRVEGSRLILECRSRQLAARISHRKGRASLAIYELRGLPDSPGFDAAPKTFWDPSVLGLGSSCPGDSAFARGECALAQGWKAEALRQFEEALQDPKTRRPALIRLGDLAAWSGDTVGAGERYQEAGWAGTWGRLAAARLCELFGACLGRREERRIFDPAGLPEPLRGELTLRHARALAFRGELEAAAAILTKEASSCGLAPDLCSRIAVEAMRSDRPLDTTAGLSLYLRLPDRTSGPLTFDLSQSAAEVAAALGAPIFGANVLAIASDFAPATKLDAHLRRTAELYLEGDDRVRAGVIVDFARGRLSRGALGSKAWLAIHQRLLPSKEVDAPIPGVPEAALLEAEREVAAALRAVQEAASLRSQNHDAAPARDSQ